MAIIGGYITDISFAHPELGNGGFTPMQNEEATYDLGGIKIASDKKMMTGKGARIYQKERGGWSMEVKCSWDRNNGNDVETALALAKSNEEAEWTFSHIDGTNYVGTGLPVGDIEGSSNSTFTLLIEGSGELQKI